MKGPFILIKTQDLRIAITHIAAIGCCVLALAAALQVEIKAARIDKQRVHTLAACPDDYLGQVVIAAAGIAPCVSVRHVDNQREG